MVEITIFEFNLDSVDLTANAPFSAAESPDDLEAESGGSRGGLPFGLGRSSEETDDDVDVVAAEEDGGGSGPLPKLVGLGLVILLVVLGRRLISGEPEPLPEEDEAMAVSP